MLEPVALAAFWGRILPCSRVGTVNFVERTSQKGPEEACALAPMPVSGAALASSEAALKGMARRAGFVRLGSRRWLRCWELAGRSKKVGDGEGWPADYAFDGRCDPWAGFSSSTREPGRRARGTARGRTGRRESMRMLEHICKAADFDHASLIIIRGRVPSGLVTCASFQSLLPRATSYDTDRTHTSSPKRWAAVLAIVFTTDSLAGSQFRPPIR